MRVLLATAELSPLVSTGGLGVAVAGLTAALRRRDDVEVDLVLPDYGRWSLDAETVTELAVDAWVGRATVRSGTHPAAGSLHLVDVPGIERGHPYADPVTKLAWPDNSNRFFGFSAAVAAVAAHLAPDVVHLNDWHTAAAPAFYREPHPTVFTIHNLAYQGNAGVEWLERFGDLAESYRRYGHLIPMAGAIAVADRVVTVSPHYAEEIITPGGGMGLAEDLAARGSDLVGILNGIDTDVWNPQVDEALPHTFRPTKLADRRRNTDELRAELGLDESEGPLLGIVTRYSHQKNVDWVFALAPYLEHLGAQLLVLGSGDPEAAAASQRLAETRPGRIAAIEAFDPELSRRIFGSLDLYLMPSRFEPCGLAQMQAMRYGAIPVVTDVGGLHDTVVDADVDPDAGTGFVTVTNDELGWLDAVHRAVRAWNAKGRRSRIQKNGMTIDWSWDESAARHVALYESLSS